MEDRLNPRVFLLLGRIFLLLGIGNLVLAVVSLVGCIVLLSTAGSCPVLAIALVAIVIFCQIALLAGWQSRVMRVLDEKFKNLQEGFGQREELPAK